MTKKDDVLVVIERELGDAWRNAVYVVKKSGKKSVAAKDAQTDLACWQKAASEYRAGEGLSAYLEILRLHQEAAGTLALAREDAKRLDSSPDTPEKEAMEAVIGLQLGQLEAEEKLLAACLEKLRKMTSGK